MEEVELWNLPPLVTNSKDNTDITNDKDSLHDQTLLRLLLTPFSTRPWLLGTMLISALSTSAKNPAKSQLGPNSPPLVSDYSWHLVGFPNLQQPPSRILLLDYKFPLVFAILRVQALSLHFKTPPWIPTPVTVVTGTGVPYCSLASVIHNFSTSQKKENLPDCKHTAQVQALI